MGAPTLVLGGTVGLEVVAVRTQAFQEFAHG